MGYLRSAVASRGMEKRVRDPEKRLLFKQGLEDAASMLQTQVEEEKVNFADKAAGKALDNIPQNFKDMILKVKTFQQNEKTCYGRC